MLVLEFQFPAGRYHATPWGRNVNEGVVEWPPSPFRLARALTDVCKRRYPDWEDGRLERVLSILAAPPAFHLPPATASHTRAYLSSNKEDPTQKQKIFDAFVVLGKAEKVFARFDTEPGKETLADLDCLLGELNYLGRSESWVRARVVEPVEGMEFKCRPADSGDGGNGSLPVQLACLKNETDYQALAEKPCEKKKGKKKQSTPYGWLRAIMMSSKELLDGGWSSPPALAHVDYLLPGDALSPRPVRVRRKSKKRFCVAKYTLSSPVLPRVTDTVPLAERVRVKLMGIHKRIMDGDPERVSPVFSGKTAGGDPLAGHAHAFILPLDEDGDGRIDHLLVRAKEPFGETELKALDGFSSVWQSKGRPDVRFVLTSLSGEVPGVAGKVWFSATPFVTARHHRKGRGAFSDWLKEEIKRECRFHGLPEPVSIELDEMRQTRGRGHKIRWAEFVRSRKDRRPMTGHGCILRFDEEVAGPFAIGALCHFGLGLFARYEGE